MTASFDIFEQAAQRESACPDCGERIREGNTITLHPHSLEWVHVTCPPPRPVCGECFMEIPLKGECC